jgi:hypothetical protein
VPIKDFYYLKKKIIYWNENQIYPADYELPYAIRFSSHFWQRIKEIYRYTKGDEHERAINIWWGDGDVVVTDSLRGERSRVNIPKQKVRVSYKPISNSSSYARKIIEVNGKVYLKKSVPLSTLKNKKKIEVQFLFNMHTHPPHKKPEGEVFYSFFSDTDIKSFVTSSAAVTGLVTDELWILAKTGGTPTRKSVIGDRRINLEYLTEELNIKAYNGKFGKAVISQNNKKEMLDN